MVYIGRFFVVKVRRNTLILSLLFESGGEHCNPVFAVEVQRESL